MTTWWLPSLMVAIWLQSQVSYCYWWLWMMLRLVYPFDLFHLLLLLNPLSESSEKNQTDFHEGSNDWMESQSRFIYTGRLLSGKELVRKQQKGDLCMQHFFIMYLSLTLIVLCLALYLSCDVYCTSRINLASSCYSSQQTVTPDEMSDGETQYSTCIEYFSHEVYSCRWPSCDENLCLPSSLSRDRNSRQYKQ